MDTAESTPVRTYEVSWSMIYQADSPFEAVSQALSDLETVVSHPEEGPNFFLVSSGNEDDPIVVSADEVARGRADSD